MVDKVSVRCGGPLATRLMAELACSPLGTAQWMNEHTYLLKKDVHSLAGTLDLGEEHCFLKLYREKSAVHKVLYRLGIGRPLRSFRAARTLLKQGLPVPEPLGCLMVPEGMLLLTEGWVSEGNLRQVWARKPGQERAQQVMQGAGQALGQLHLSRHAHGDCKWTNLLWDGNGICFVDLDSVSRSSVHSARQARDLARFTLNAEELEIGSQLYDIFLDSYLQTVKLSRQKAVERMAPSLYALRAKHLSRYGPRGQRLV